MLQGGARPRRDRADRHGLAAKLGRRAADAGDGARGGAAAARPARRRADRGAARGGGPRQDVRVRTARRGRGGRGGGRARRARIGGRAAASRGERGRERPVQLAPRAHAGGDRQRHGPAEAAADPLARGRCAHRDRRKRVGGRASSARRRPAEQAVGACLRAADEAERRSRSGRRPSCSSASCRTSPIRESERSCSAGWVISAG